MRCAFGWLATVITVSLGGCRSTTGSVDGRAGADDASADDANAPTAQSAIRSTPAPIASNQRPPMEVRSGRVASVSFIEAVPSGATTSDRLPLILGLHGQGQSPEQFLVLLRGLRSSARLVLPSADPSNGVHSWYQGESTDPGSSGPDKAARRLFSFVRPLLEARPTVGRPILVGYSQGAIVAMTLAALHGNTFDTILPIAGRLPPALFARVVPSGTPAPMLEAFHGETDRTVPYSACRASLEAFQAKNYATRLHTYEEVGHEIATEELSDIGDALTRAVERTGSERNEQPEP